MKINYFKMFVLQCC